MKKSSVAHLIEQGYLPSRFETPHKTQDRRLKLIGALKRGNPTAQSLAQKLLRCRGRQPCQSASCPSCRRHTREWWVPALVKLLRTWLGTHQDPGQQLVAFSAIPLEGQLSAAGLKKASLPPFRATWAKRFERCNLPDPLLVAGFDFSWNESSERRWTSHFQIHIYGITTVGNWKIIEEELGHLFPRTESILVPLTVRQCKDLAESGSYILKPFFQRRVSYIPPAGEHRTRKLILRGQPQRELACWLDRYCPTDSLIQMGIKRYGRTLKLVPQPALSSLSDTLESH